MTQFHKIIKGNQSNRQDKLTELLADKHQNPFIPENGQSPFQLAVELSRWDLVNLLIQAECALDIYAINLPSIVNFSGHLAFGEIIYQTSPEATDTPLISDIKTLQDKLVHDDTVKLRVEQYIAAGHYRTTMFSKKLASLIKLEIPEINASPSISTQQGITYEHFIAQLNKIQELDDNQQKELIQLFTLDRHKKTINTTVENMSIDFRSVFTRRSIVALLMIGLVGLIGAAVIFSQNNNNANADTLDATSFIRFVAFFSAASITLFLLMAAVSVCFRYWHAQDSMKALELETQSDTPAENPLNIFVKELTKLTGNSFTHTSQPSSELIERAQKISENTLPQENDFAHFTTLFHLSQQKSARNTEPKTQECEIEIPLEDEPDEHTPLLKK